MPGYQRLARRAVAGVVLATWLAMSLACSGARVVTAPAAPVAARVVVDGTRGPPQCRIALRVDGAAYPRGGQLEVVIPRAWIAVTRVNDKQRDDLHLGVSVGRGAVDEEQLPHLDATGLTVVLRPTVDSAGAVQTTWTASDTLRLLVPWSRTLAPRWLYFTVQYLTVSHAGRLSSCGHMLRSDTLRFTAVGAVR